MTDPADFLSRWSRRKRKAAKALPDRDAGQAQDDALKSEAGIESDAPPQVAAGDKKKPPTAAETKPEEPAFDISKLPSIESITGETDIRAFLTPGVPAALRQAALRQAWSADPKIRDFIEMAENQWDFNAPGEILGFDFSAPTGDIKRMIADIYGKLPASESEIEAQSETLKVDKNVPNTVPTNRAIDSHRNVTGTSSDYEEGDAAALNPTELSNDPVRQTLVAQRSEENTAPQKNDAVQDSETESRPRPHGGAMPK